MSAIPKITLYTRKGCCLCDEAKRVFGSMAAALDSLNTIRNRATLAHPNELLLEAPEAMLFINLSRAVLAYIETKMK